MEQSKLVHGGSTQTKWQLLIAAAAGLAAGYILSTFAKSETKEQLDNAAEESAHLSESTKDHEESSKSSERRQPVRPLSTSPTPSQLPLSISTSHLDGSSTQPPPTPSPLPTHAEGFPQRIAVGTFNIWRDIPDNDPPHPCQPWSFREAALKQFFKHHVPDIWMIQEVTPGIYQHFKELLPSQFECHRSFGAEADKIIAAQDGEEENIFWNRRLFQFESGGREVIGGHSEPGVGDYKVLLTWVRLKPNYELRCPDGLVESILVGTTHLTHETCVLEMETHSNPRHSQTISVCEKLNGLRKEGEPVIFGGDLNDAIHPTRLLWEHAKMKDCFFDLGMSAPPTFPSLAGDLFREDSLCRGQRCFDWIFTTDDLRSVSAMAINFSYEGRVPSDHIPVIAMFECARGDPWRSNRSKSVRFHYHG